MAGWQVNFAAELLAEIISDARCNHQSHVDEAAVALRAICVKRMTSSSLSASKFIQLHSGHAAAKEARRRSTARAHGRRTSPPRGVTALGPSPSSSGPQKRNAFGAE